MLADPLSALDACAAHGVEQGCPRRPGGQVRSFASCFVPVKRGCGKQSLQRGTRGAQEVTKKAISGARADNQVLYTELSGMLAHPYVARCRRC